LVSYYSRKTLIVAGVKADVTLYEPDEVGNFHQFTTTLYSLVSVLGVGADGKTTYLEQHILTANDATITDIRPGLQGTFTVTGVTATFTGTYPIFFIMSFHSIHTYHIGTRVADSNGWVYSQDPAQGQFWFESCSATGEFDGQFADCQRIHDSTPALVGAPKATVTDGFRDIILSGVETIQTTFSGLAPTTAPVSSSDGDAVTMLPSDDGVSLDAVSTTSPPSTGATISAQSPPNASSGADILNVRTWLIVWTVFCAFTLLI
jgi:hypothetical protein